jgi:hypothetical protein
MVGVRCRYGGVGPEDQQCFRSRLGAQGVQQLVGTAPRTRQRTGQHAPLFGDVRAGDGVGDQPIAGQLVGLLAVFPAALAVALPGEAPVTAAVTTR